MTRILNKQIEPKEFEYKFIGTLIVFFFQVHAYLTRLIIKNKNTELYA